MVFFQGMTYPSIHAIWARWAPPLGTIHILRKHLKEAQLPGRLFSPSDISKKLSHHFLLHFPIGMGSYDHHAKYQGVFMDLL
jgi:hypothetical protein